VVRQEGPLERALDLAGCYAVVTDVAAGRVSDQAVHDTYVSVQRVERGFRQMKTGLLEYRRDEHTTVTRLPRPDARQQEILAALQVHLPTK